METLEEMLIAQMKANQQRQDYFVKLNADLTNLFIECSENGDYTRYDQFIADAFADKPEDSGRDDHGSREKSQTQ